MNEFSMIRALLGEAPPSAEVIAEGRQRIAVGHTRQRGHRTWRVVPAAGVAMAGMAVAVTVAVTAGGPGTPPRGSAGHQAFGPARTASGILRNAALAAMELPAGTPSPGQFVYTKLYRQQATGAGVMQTWSSADGTRLGFVAAGPDKSALPACRDGFWIMKVVGQPVRKTRNHCSAAENAAYLPAMPTSAAALRAYLRKSLGTAGLRDSGLLLTSIESMMTTDYLTPPQRAALYHLLARTPGLTVVPHISNVRGQAGVGVRSQAYKGSIWTIIFNRATYAPLGMNGQGISGPVKGTHNGEVVLRQTIVRKTPPLP